MKNTKPLLIPCLRGHFGDWVYYSGLVPAVEVAERVSFATEIHPDRALSELIQRSLEGARSKHIAQYLATTERFFNSMVLATYGGDPEWLEVGNFRTTRRSELLSAANEWAKDTIGFLSITGKEKIFAVDGQHRLAGIKLALEQGLDLSQDQVPVLLIGHRKTKTGLLRTRRLFTTLNKTAVPVYKKDIIALDEDDVMAIVSRRLVETVPSFRDPKIAVIASPNLPTTNRTALTTISNLYDVLKVLFLFDTQMRSDRHLRFNRPSDERLERFFQLAVEFFDLVGEFFPPVRRLFEADEPSMVTSRYRGPKGGHVLFRAIGLEMLVKLVTELAKDEEITLRQAFKRFEKMPTDLTLAPYRNIIWNPAKETMIPRGKTLARQLIKHMAGMNVSDKLVEEYRRAMGHDYDDEDIDLPEPF